MSATVDSADAQLRLLSERLAAWARGGVRPRVNGDAHEVVAEHPAAVEWLADPGTGLLGSASVVFVLDSGAAPLPDGPGTWVRASGSVALAGDEVGLSRDFYVQTTDYVSARYLSIVGPTLLRVTDEEDARQFLGDVDEAFAGGAFPELPAHPLVELGDRCALAGGVDCATPLLQRLYVDPDGLVRPSAGGRVLGEVGDPVAALRTAAAGAARAADPCVDAGAAELIAAYDGSRLRAYLAAIDALRTLALREPAPRRVSGFGFRLLDDGMPAEPRSDLLLLFRDGEVVLFGAEARRGFRLTPPVAELVEAILVSESSAEAVRRLHAAGRGAVAAGDLESLCAEFVRRGVPLAYRDRRDDR